MPAAPSDSEIYRKLLGDAELGKLFTDTAELRAMMIVEGALAKVQGELGVIPEIAGAAIHRASLELQLDPSGLANGVAQSAVPVPALVSAMREAMQAPEYAQYLHWGATSQDIVDTALALRLRQAISILDGRLGQTVRSLGALADKHADLPMVARTYGQAAVVTSFGAHVAAWGMPLLRQRQRLSDLRSDIEKVSLSGAAGTLSAMGAEGPAVRAGLAEALKLADPGASWHTQRDGIAALASCLTGLSGALAKMAEDVLILTQSGVSEIVLGSGGGSSTMPQKSNPILPSVISAIHKQVTGLNSAVQSALPHRQERDGAAWLTEWMSLPQMIILTGCALNAAADIASAVTPNAERMAGHIDETRGTLFAEALSFALAGQMPRPDAQKAVKDLVSQANTSGQNLAEVARAAYPNLDLASVFDPNAQLGTAPADARAFARISQSPQI